MTEKLIPEYAAKLYYYHHSNPSSGDGPTFWNKTRRRKIVGKAWSIVKGEIKGDKELALQTIDEYFDSNVKMHSGKVVQEICDKHLLDNMPYAQALKEGYEKLREYKIPTWRDHAKETAELEHKEKLLYAQKEVKGEMVWKKSDEGTASEMDLVAAHAIEGLKEAQSKNGLNRLEAEVDLYKPLPGCDLMYNGKPDYSKRIELKTQWDGNIHTGSPRANSLPQEIRPTHMTQIAGYWHLTNKTIPTIVYANRVGYRLFTPSEDQLQNALDFIIESCQRRERLLKRAKDVEDLLRLCDPQWGAMFGWKDLHPTVLENAKKIWR